VLGAAGSPPGAWFAGAAGSGAADREEFEIVSSATGPAVLPATSTRGTIGTAFETAALIDAAVAVEVLARRAIPPAGLVSTPDPALTGLDVVTGGARPIAGESGVLITAWNHGTSSGSAGAAYLSPARPGPQEEGAA
jgi:3-oxoacyl-[acyl-carrier-protein] synthase II